MSIPQGPRTGILSLAQAELEEQFARADLSCDSLDVHSLSDPLEDGDSFGVIPSLHGTDELPQDEVRLMELLELAFKLRTLPFQGRVSRL